MQVYEKLYIDGKWVTPSSTTSIEVTNPTNEQIIGKVPAGGVSDVDLAVSAAKKAFPIWSKSSIEERISILNSLSSEIKERTEELAQTITAEVGTPIFLEVWGKKYGGKISQLPFYKKSYVK